MSFHRRWSSSNSLKKKTTKKAFFAFKKRTKSQRNKSNYVKLLWTDHVKDVDIWLCVNLFSNLLIDGNTVTWYHVVVLQTLVLVKDIMIKNKIIRFGKFIGSLLFKKFEVDSLAFHFIHVISEKWDIISELCTVKNHHHHHHSFIF